MRRRATLGAAAAAAGLALAAAGCGGGSSGPETDGATADAKAAAETVLAFLAADTATTVRRVECGAIDFALTYRCAVARERAEGADGPEAPAGLVCAVRPLGDAAVAPEPYCITEPELVAEDERRAGLVERALARLNGPGGSAGTGRLPVEVARLKSLGFTIGCSVGFRTVRAGAAQSDDVMVTLLAVQTESGRSLWAALTAPADEAAAVALKRGVDPRERPTVNPVSQCEIDAAGRAALGGDARSAALLPSA